MRGPGCAPGSERAGEGGDRGIREPGEEETMTTLCLLLTAAVAGLPIPSADSIGEGLRVNEQPSQEDTLPTLEDILDRYVEAVGGHEAFERLTTRVMSGNLVTDLPSRQPPVHESNHFTIYAKAPGKYLYIQESAEGTHRDGLDGETCWRQAGAEITLEAYCDRTFAWLVDPQNALRMWDYFPEMRVVGRRTLEGRPVYRVDVDDRESHSLYFDVETALLVRLGIFTELHDYREVDGVLVPFEMAISRKGGCSTYVFEKIEHNVPIDDARFAVPVR
jgi:hypothetical protein